MTQKELAIRGSCGYPDEYPEVISDLAAMGAAADKLISHRFDFDNFYDAVARRTAASRKVMVEFGA